MEMKPREIVSSKRLPGNYSYVLCMTTYEDVLRDLGADPERISDLARGIDALSVHPLAIITEDPFEIGVWYVWILYMRTFQLSQDMGEINPPLTPFRCLAERLREVGDSRIPGDLILFTRETQLISSLAREVQRVLRTIYTAVGMMEECMTRLTILNNILTKVGV